MDSAAGVLVDLAAPAPRSAATRIAGVHSLFADGGNPSTPVAYPVYSIADLRRANFFEAMAALIRQKTAARARMGSASGGSPAASIS